MTSCHTFLTLSAITKIFVREKNVNFCSSNLFHDNFILATRFQCFTDCPMVCNPKRKSLSLVVVGRIQWKPLWDGDKLIPITD